MLLCGRTRLFDAAEVVLTLAAAETFVGTTPKPLGMLKIDQFPAQQDEKRHKKQAPGEKTGDKEHGCVHHKMTPVEDAAVDTAAVIHNPALKRTEKENADQVTDIIKHGQQKEFGNPDPASDVR